MAGKKQPGRFTIQFSPADPQQRQVIELLNQQGRRKAVFLTAAVLSYCGKSTPPSGSLPQQLDLTTIEQVVRKVLQEINLSEQKENTERSNSTRAEKSRSTLPCEDSELTEDLMNSISEMIDAFRS